MKLSSSPLPGKRDLRSSKILIITALCLSLWLIFRWFYYVAKYSANVWFMDQWDLSTYFFNEASLKELFFLQNGPHRQGLGFVISKLLADSSGWNAKAECWAIGGFMFLAGLLALFLKRKLTGRLVWMDLTIPILFISPMHWELFAGTPNLSHGSVPLFLLVLLALSFLRDGAIACAVTLLVDFLAIFTGFGLFAGFVVPVVFLLRTVHDLSNKRYQKATASLLAFLVSGFFIILFFRNYNFLPANPDFAFPIEGWWIEYPKFAACVFANILGIKIQTVGLPFIEIFSSLILVIITFVGGYHLLKLIPFKSGSQETNRALHEIIFLLIAFTLLFLANTSIGRASFGVMGSQASRYIAYLVPGVLALYLHISSIERSGLRFSMQTSMLVLMACATIPMRDCDYKSMKLTFERKEKWIASYFETESILHADKESGFSMYPNPEATRMKEKLHKLKTMGKNLYLDYPKPDKANNTDLH